MMDKRERRREINRRYREKNKKEIAFNRRKKRAATPIHLRYGSSRKNASYWRNIKEIIRGTRGCCDCGTQEALEWDHIDPKTKSFCIGSFSNAPSKENENKFVQEMEKCRIVCRICHRKRTHKCFKGPTRPKNRIIKDFINKKKMEYGECSICKRLVNLGEEYIFDFDHIIPSTKNFNIKYSKVLKGGLEECIEAYEKEIEKCQLLCANCHLIKTRADWDDGHIKPWKYGFKGEDTP